VARRDGSAGRRRRPPHRLAARTGPGRQLVDQRDGLHPRQPGGLRRWRDDYGCEGWGYADLLPCFIRAEDQQHGASEYHGAGGPLRVEDARYTHPLSRAWLAAATEHGLRYNGDFNAAEQDGVGPLQLTMRDGRRWSAADAYLRPSARPNLDTETGALVTKIVIEHERAAGVRCVRDGVEREVRAGEVVLGRERSRARSC
jgi:choline dehydrogenase-like flavoprotein